MRVQAFGTVKSKLTLLVGLIFLISLVLVGVGAFGMRTANEDLRNVYEQRTVAIQTIATLDSRLQARSAILTEAALDPANSAAKTAIAASVREKLEIEAAWRQFRARPLMKEERVLADKYEQLYSVLQDNAFKPLEGVLDFGDPVAAGALVYNKLHVELPKVNAALQELKDLEVKLARDEYEASIGRAQLLFIVLMGTLVTGLTVAALLGIVVTRSLYAQLGGEPKYAASLLRALAAGQLGLDVVVSPRDKGSLIFDLHHMRNALEETVRHIRDASESVAMAADEIASGNSDLSVRTETQAARLEQTSHRIKTLTSTVSTNAANAVSASGLAAKAVVATHNGSRAVSDAVSSMQSISDASSCMSQIVATIQSIAFQTNILALNAAVESARAGTHGRGFAVVAGEVRTLAQRSAEAAHQVRELIETTVERVRQGAEHVELAGSSMATIDTIVQQVATLVGEIAAASRSQSEGLISLSTAADEMEYTTQQNAALVEQAAAAAGSLKEQSHVLASAVGRFAIAA